MASFGRLEALFLAWFSRPVSERLLYRAIRRQGFNSLVEIGVGTARRSKRLIRVVQVRDQTSPINYAGIDLFELRPWQETARLSLKDAYRQLKATGARIRLLPGDPFTVLSRQANVLTGTDLLVISADQDPASLERAWFYVPRMLHGRSLVFVEGRNAKTGTNEFRLLPADEIRRFGGLSRLLCRGVRNGWQVHRQ